MIIKFSRNYIFKNKIKKLISCHFLVERKPQERTDLLITASMNIYQAKKNPPFN